MWSNLLILHSEDKERDLESYEGLYYWKTCMRSLYIGDIRIFDHSIASRSKYFKTYIGVEAYSLLLEIVSGIRSRLLGETEILSQFKEVFNNSSLPKNSIGEYLGKLRDQIIEDSRKIRSGHLRSLGDQSYGGLANRYLKEDKTVALIGTGNLSSKMIPWLKQNNRRVILVGRNTDKLVEFKNKFQVEIQTLDNFIPDELALVIAAPINISTWTKGAKKIIDFREKVLENNLKDSDTYYSFHFMLNSLKLLEERNSVLREKLKKISWDLALERENTSMNFIYGWEDLHCLAV